jgi:hypothetical protein
MHGALQMLQSCCWLTVCGAPRVALPFPAASARQLATSVLPRLALYGTLPPSLVPQLLPVLASDDRRAARLAAYLLQVQLGCGSGGTPTLPPTRGQLLLCPT